MKIENTDVSEPIYQQIIVISLVIIFCITGCSKRGIDKDDLRPPVGLIVNLIGPGKVIHVDDTFEAKIRVYIEKNVFTYHDTLAENGNEVLVSDTMDSLYITIQNSFTNPVFEFVTDSTRIITPIAVGDSLVFNVTLKAISTGMHSLIVEAYFLDENWKYPYNEAGDLLPTFIWTDNLYLGVK